MPPDRSREAIEHGPPFEQVDPAAVEGGFRDGECDLRRRASSQLSEAATDGHDGAASARIDAGPVDLDPGHPLQTRPVA
jgi:hypothetical protein